MVKILKKFRLKETCQNNNLIFLGFVLIEKMNVKRNG